MSPIGVTKKDLAWSIVLGMGRGICVQTFLYPFDVVKIRQQCSDGLKSTQVARALLREEGVGAFYKGLEPKLLQTIFKQFWCWPMIRGFPPFLEHYHIGNLQQQAITGIAIATADAAFLTPLEKSKIKIATVIKGTAKFSFVSSYKGGWPGFKIYWYKLCVTWVAFLTIQKYLRDQYSPKEPLALSQLVKVATESAFFVSFISFPFELANTRKQALDLSPTLLLNRKEIFKLYSRGWPPYFFCLLIHNIASVALIDKLYKS